MGVLQAFLADRPVLIRVRLAESIGWVESLLAPRLINPAPRPDARAAA